MDVNSMKTKSQFSKKIENVDKICSGSLLEEISGSLLICKELDAFSLHDSLIYRYEFSNGDDDGYLLSVFGLKPSFSEIFKIDFFSVKDFISSGFSPVKSFSIKELSVNVSDRRKAYFSGDFDGQNFSFFFVDSRFTKYVLREPVTRDDMGL
jgi:hypothetical protein